APQAQLLGEAVERLAVAFARDLRPGRLERADARGRVEALKGTQTQVDCHGEAPYTKPPAGARRWVFAPTAWHPRSDPRVRRSCRRGGPAIHAKVWATSVHRANE